MIRILQKVTAVVMLGANALAGDLTLMLGDFENGSDGFDDTIQRDTSEFKLGHASHAGKLGGKKGGAYAKENRTGIFALTPDQIKAKNQKAAITKLINNGKACAWPKKE